MAVEKDERLLLSNEVFRFKFLSNSFYSVLNVCELSTILKLWSSEYMYNVV